MAWLQEIPRGSGRFYLYRYSSDTGKAEYVGKASQHQVQEHRWEEMLRDKMDAGEANQELVKSIFASLTSKTPQFEKGTGKNVRITKKNDYALNLEVGQDQFVVQFGGSVYFRKDKQDRYIAIANPSEKPDGRTKEVFVTFSKPFFSKINATERDVVMEEIQQSLSTRGLGLGDVPARFDDQIGDGDLYARKKYNT